MVFHLEHRRHQNNEASRVRDASLRAAGVLSGGEWRLRSSVVNTSTHCRQARGNETNDTADWQHR